METCHTCHYLKLRRAYNPCNHKRNCNEQHRADPKKVYQCSGKHSFYCSHPDVCGRITENTPACSYYEHDSLVLLP